MSDLHFVGATGVEGVDPKFVREGLFAAREKTWAALRAIQSVLREGMTEVEAHDAAKETLVALGSTRHWHRPYVRFGSGTVRTFHEALRSDYRLKAGDPVTLDLGPVWTDPASGMEYEGDVGDSFVFEGSDPEFERLARCTRGLWKEARDLWRDENATGERLYEFLKVRAAQEGWSLVERVTGHRISDYPHSKYAKERLNKVAFSPTTSLWILELQVNDPGERFGAFYEDLLC